MLLVLLLGGGFAFLCCVGTVGAIAIPNFIKFGVRAKQAEVKVNLKAAYQAERAWFEDKSTYSESVEEVGFIPERSNRYLYLLSATGELLLPGALDGGQHGSIGADLRHDRSPDNVALLAGIPADLLAEAGMHGTCPDSCRMTVLAAGNLDNDATVDVWSVSTAARTIDGVPVPAGTPHKHIDDVNE